MDHEKYECGEAVILRIQAQPEQLPQARDAIALVATALGFPEEDRCHAVLALDEALANVIKHGYGRACGEPIDIRIVPISSEGRVGVSVAIRDFGRQVNPEEIKSRDLDDIRPGGLGVHIIRSVMDEVNYEHAEAGGMRLTMTKWVKR